MKIRTNTYVFFLVTVVFSLYTQTINAAEKYSINNFIITPGFTMVSLIFSQKKERVITRSLVIRRFMTGCAVRDINEHRSHIVELTNGITDKIVHFPVYDINRCLWKIIIR
jgi:hypothetical protein